MVGNLDVPNDVLAAGGDVGKDRGEQVVGPDALDLWRNFLAALKTQQGQRAGCVPAPAGAEDGRCQRCLLQDRRHCFGMQKLKNIGQRKAVLFGESDVQAVVGGGRLQFEIESAAEALAQRQSPGLVDAAAERGMNDELHASAFVEKAFGNDRRLGRHFT